MRIRRACTSGAIAACAAFSLAGCGSLTIHDEGRSKLASDGRQAYVDSKVTEAPAIEAKNLDFLLSEEVKTVTDNVATQVDFAALGIVSNSGPMSASVDAAVQRLGALGFSRAQDVRRYISARTASTDKLATARTEASVLTKLGIPAPECEAVLASPDELPKPPDDATAKELFDKYLGRCREAQLPALPATGLLGQAGREWSRAQKELTQLAADWTRAQLEVKNAAAAYQAAAAQGKGGPDLAKDLADKEAKLLDALQAAQKLKLGGAFESSIDALVEILSAAASDQPNPSDPVQARAAVVLKALPSLAADAQAFQDARSTVPVSGLLLELQRQTVLANAVAKRQQLMQQRVAILKARVDAHLNEAERWLRFTDAACSNAVLVAGWEHPLNKCDEFALTRTGCSLAGKEIAPCSLAQPWKTRFNTDKGEARRELYKAATSYLQAVSAQAPALEQQYREIDVRQREALLAKTTALAAWDNLVSVPLDQLEAYYKGGIRPAELADLIVKALGVIAITVGVTK